MPNTELSPLNPPVYSTLKNLYLNTAIVRDGAARATIVAPADGTYDRQARIVQEAIIDRCGVTVPIVDEHSEARKIPLTDHIIALGNRSTNAVIGELYNRYFTLLDLRYPGPNGYVVRTLHNPFGGGHNVIFLGGSDAHGVTLACEAFCRIVQQAASAEGNLSVGRLAEIQLGDGMDVPDDIRNVETWEASALYKSIGYFGWNSISKHMALYYMTGREHHAHEFLRLAFPDETAKKEIFEIDDERIENKDDPLAGPYHYAAIMLILFWDLIEESDVFTDGQRLAVTNAFARQLAHPQERVWRKALWDRWGGDHHFDVPPENIGCRHEMWSYLSLYGLSRYFQRDYPHELWRFCRDGAMWSFSSLKDSYWGRGLFGQHHWFSSSMAPILTYTLLAGDRGAVEGGTLEKLLLGQEILLNGGANDASLASASIGFLHKAAYLTGDGRWRTYLQRTGMDLGTFRVGQSFWPEASMAPSEPTDRAGCWTLLAMPEGMWGQQNEDIKRDQAFVFGSYRSGTDETGDCLLFDTHKEQIFGPWHTFRIKTLRIAGHGMLEGIHNQLFVRADGLMPDVFSLTAAVTRSDVVGSSVVVTAQTEHAGYAAWERSVLLRQGQYALVVDRVTFSAACGQTEVETLWSGKGPWSILPEGLGFAGDSEQCPPQIRPCDRLENSIRSDQCARTVWRGPTEKGQRITYFTLLVPGGPDSIACRRCGDHAAVMTLSDGQIALTAAGRYDRIEAELVVLSETELHARGIRKLMVDKTTILQADEPADCHWDFNGGVLTVICQGPVTLQASGQKGEVSLTAGRHVINDATLPDGIRTVVKAYLDRQVTELPQWQTPNTRPAAGKPATTLPVSATVDLGGAVTAMTALPPGGTYTVAAAEGQHIHLWNAVTGKKRMLNAGADIQRLHVWCEENLLAAGCVNGQVAAFDLATGQRQWTVQSDMDPAVLRAGKPYWFNTAPGCVGIGGLYSGAFWPDPDGRTQLLVGSACTLEILAPDGKLLRRLPVFWGPGRSFGLIDTTDGSRNLLVARRPADTHAAVVISNQHEYVPNMLGPDPLSFDDVPPGHTDMRIWGGMTGNDILCDDIDGDGCIEVIRDITGGWNRITVWNDKAVPLWNVNLGPGPVSGRQDTYGGIVRGLALPVLDPTGPRHIAAVTSDGWVILLNHQCRKCWAQHLDDSPTVMRVCGTGESTRIVTACENGTVVLLDGEGTITQTAQVDGLPVEMERVGQNVVIGTDKGILVVIPVDSGG